MRSSAEIESDITSDIKALKEMLPDVRQWDWHLQRVLDECKSVKELLEHHAQKEHPFPDIIIEMAQEKEAEGLDFNQAVFNILVELDDSVSAHMISAFSRYDEKIADQAIPAILAIKNIPDGYRVFEIAQIAYASPVRAINAMDAIMSLKNPATEIEIMNALWGQALFGKHESISCYAVWRLAELGMDCSREALLDIAQKKPELAYDVMEIFTKDGTAKSLSDMAKIGHLDEALGRAAIRNLVSVGNDAAVTSLYGFMQTHPEETMQAFEVIGSNRAAGALRWFGTTFSEHTEAVFTKLLGLKESFNEKAENKVDPEYLDGEMRKLVSKTFKVLPLVTRLQAYSPQQRQDFQDLVVKVADSVPELDKQSLLNIFTNCATAADHRREEARQIASAQSEYAKNFGPQ